MDSRNFCHEIPELIKLLKPLFHVGAFDQIHNLLMNRMTFEFGNLRRDLDMMTQRCNFAERRISQAEHERSLFLWQLQESRNENKNLLLEMKKLRNNEILLREMLMKADERCAADQERHSEIVDERNQAVLELKNQLSQTSVIMADLRAKRSKDDQTIQELRSRISEASVTAEDLRVKQSNADKTIQELRCINLEAAKIVKQLKRRLSKSDEIVTDMRLTQEKSDIMIEKLKHQSLVARGRAEELRFQKLKAYKASERKKKKLDDLVPITMKMEEFSAVLKDKIDYFANLAKSEENSFVNGDANFLCSEDGKQGVENTGVGSSNAGNKNLDSLSLIKEEGANGKNTGTSYQAGRHSTCTHLAENCVLYGNKEMKIISLSDSDDDSCSSTIMDKLVYS